MNKTAIEYLTHTWNPIKMRCTPVSVGKVDQDGEPIVPREMP